MFLNQSVNYAQMVLVNSTEAIVCDIVKRTAISLSRLPNPVYFLFL
ncbi:hypothetical protein ACO2KH_14465 [Leptospira terpstrae]